MLGASIVFLADARLYCVKDQQIRELNSQYVENFKNNIIEIRKKNAWKTTGRGAGFMGIRDPGDGEAEAARAAVITAVAPIRPDKLVYACNVGNVGGLYVKNPLDDQETEGYIIRKKSMMIFELDYCPVNGNVIASISEDQITKNLALFHEQSTQEEILTEGEAVDRNPCFSKINPNLIYYDSAGYSLTEHGIGGGLSERCILSLDLTSGAIEVVAEQPEYDLFKPKEAADGSLYYLRKPRKEAEPARITLRELIQMPGKLGRAIFGWLNFFTQRYSGESLKGSTGPAKAKTRTEEQIFVEGNLIHVAKSMRDNQAAGDKYPGIAPRGWQLMKRSPGGQADVLVKGLLDYALGADGTVYYSNGKYIIEKRPDGKETLVCEKNMAFGMQVF